jgi:hypothetical protein
VSTIEELNWIFKYYLERNQRSWLQIERSGFDSLRYQIFWEVVCLAQGALSLVSTIEELNWIFKYYLERNQRSWLQIERSGFDSRCYQIFWEAVCLKQGALSLVSTIEELLGRKSNGSGLENRDYGRMDPLRWLRDAPLTAKFGTNFFHKRRSLGR